MNGKFDIEKMKGNAPYRVADGLFERMEANVWSEVKDELKLEAKPTGKRRWTVARWMTAAAAVAAIFVVVKLATPAQPKADYAAVEQAFSQLSDADQAYLLEIYQEDVFNEDEDI